MAKKQKEAQYNFSIKTARLADLVGRVVKGAGNNKDFPITQMLGISLTNGQLTLFTTDATNYFYVTEDKILGNDFNVTVGIDIFTKLVAKTTSEDVSISFSDGDGFIKFFGNGDYSIPIEFESDGVSSIVFPDPLKDFEADGEGADINLSSVVKILTVVKPALAVTMEEPCYTGYYVGDKLVATNQFIVNILDVNLFGQSRLISSAVMDLLGVMEEEKIHVDFKDNVMVFSTKDCTVYSHEQEGIEEFAVDSILEYLNIEFPAHCKITKSVFLQVLDRLSLFVTALDDGGVNLTFTKEGLQVSSKSSSGVEVIPYAESENFMEFTCCTDIGLLTKQVKSQLGDTVDLWYGDEVVLKLVDGNVTKIIALLADSSEK